MVAFLTTVVLAASALFPLAHALPVPAASLQARCDTCSGSDSLGLGYGTTVDSDISAVVDSTTDLATGYSTGLGLGSSTGAGSSTSTGTSTSTSSSTNVDVLVWAKDLDVKVRAIISTKLDGNTDLSSSCTDIIAVINSSLDLYTDIKVYSSTDLSALVKLIAALYIDLVIAICKYSATSISACSTVLIQLDVCLKGLLTGLSVQYGGFIGLCTTLITGAGLNLSSFTAIDLTACADLFFGTSISA